MVALMKSLRHDERGATAIEYALIAALISVTCIAWATFTGTTLTTTFQNIGLALQNS